MHLTPSDPDIATIKRKIDQGRLDLQPNFQRGEVWGKQKKQRLIDSILRGWHIPPIHVIQVPNSDKQEVLDGQQRLAAIRDFLNGEFPILGFQEPLEEMIKPLDGLFWNNLPENIKGKVEDFTIRILTISDYKMGEPGELFYRLNQPTNLTSAEQRNAYFGEARQQVKNIVQIITDYGYSTETIGFSNSRMAYDDVIAKCLLTIESGNLSSKMTANAITYRYRESSGFSVGAIIKFERITQSFINAIKERRSRVKLNKATLFSWLIFYYECEAIMSIDENIMTEFFNSFESIKESSIYNEEYRQLIPKKLTASFVNTAMSIYIDRSSSRVADISSVKLRDFILWGLFLSYYPEYENGVGVLNKISSSCYYLSSQPNDNSEYSFLEIIAAIKWEGKLL